MRLIPQAIFLIPLGSGAVSELTKALNNIKVYKGGTEVTTLAKTWKDEYKKIELTFTQPLEQGESYRVVMEDKVKDYEGIFIDQFDQFTFSTLNKISVSLNSGVTWYFCTIELSI